jgi:hypothetical protein
MEREKYSQGAVRFARLGAALASFWTLSGGAEHQDGVFAGDLRDAVRKVHLSDHGCDP